jgi:hypothetical protein
MICFLTTAARLIELVVKHDSDLQPCASCIRRIDLESGSDVQSMSLDFAAVDTETQTSST